ATAALIGLAPGGYDERRWPAVLETLGETAPSDAAALVDSLVRRGNVSPGQRARLLLADGIRWRRAGDQERFRARLLQAEDVARDSVEGRTARVHLLLSDLQRLRDLDRLAVLVSELDRIAQEGGVAASLAAPAVVVLGRVTGSDQEESADLHRFLVAEVV